MRPEVHLHPDRLRAHAAAASELSDALQAALLGAGRPPLRRSEASRHAVELERLDTAVRRALRELADLSAALVAAAAAAQTADAEAARAFQQAANPP